MIAARLIGWTVNSHCVQTFPNFPKITHFERTFVFHKCNAHFELIKCQKHSCLMLFFFFVTFHCGFHSRLEWLNEISANVNASVFFYGCRRLRGLSSSYETSVHPAGYCRQVAWFERCFMFDANIYCIADNTHTQMMCIFNEEGKETHEQNTEQITIENKKEIDGNRKERWSRTGRAHTHTNYRRCSHHMHSTWPYVNDFRTKSEQTKLNWKTNRGENETKTTTAPLLYQI